jgi:hypothetical protein
MHSWNSTASYNKKEIKATKSAVVDGSDICGNLKINYRNYAVADTAV